MGSILGSPILGNYHVRSRGLILSNSDSALPGDYRAALPLWKVTLQQHMPVWKLLTSKLNLGYWGNQSNKRNGKLDDRQRNSCQRLQHASDSHLMEELTKPRGPAMNQLLGRRSLCASAGRNHKCANKVQVIQLLPKFPIHNPLLLVSSRPGMLMLPVFFLKFGL